MGNKSQLLTLLYITPGRIRSGSQLKLIIAMKVGPIHAHRSKHDVINCDITVTFIVQLEDSAFLEIAEYLQSQ